MVRSIIRRVIVPIALASVALAACGGDDEASPSDTAIDAPAGTGAPTVAEATGATLTIADFAFSDVTVAAGTPIALTNDDGSAHTVTDQGGSFDVRVEAGATEVLTIAEPGTYSIVCKIHASMKGTIVVE